MPTQRLQIPRAPRLTLFPTVLAVLIGINGLLFALGQLTVRDGGVTVPLQAFFVHFGALFPIDSPDFQPWQFITSMFLHAGIGHIFFNMLALWMFGVELANLWGTRRFLIYYFVCGLGAGIAQVTVSYLMHDGNPSLGASGAVMGVIVAFSMLFPNRVIFILPFPPMPARFAAFVVVGIDLFMGVTGSTDHVAHFAHLGGAVVGFVLIWTVRRRALRGLSNADRAFSAQEAPPRPPAPARIADLPIVDLRQHEVEAAASARRTLPVLEFGDDQELIDALLDKAIQKGYYNLTPEEKELLSAASKRMK